VPTYIRNIPVRVTIEGTDPRIIPDLSASADIVLDQQENALLIPAEAVNARGAKTFVYVKKDGQYEAREVELGFRNETQVAVKSGLSAGEEVVLGTPPVAKAGT
jgi:membrane fusion protein (multidrug efflux system)